MKFTWRFMYLTIQRLQNTLRFYSLNIIILTINSAISKFRFNGSRTTHSFHLKNTRNFWLHKKDCHLSFFLHIYKILLYFQPSDSKPSIKNSSLALKVLIKTNYPKLKLWRKILCQRKKLSNKKRKHKNSKKKNLKKHEKKTSFLSN